MEKPTLIWSKRYTNPDHEDLRSQVIDYEVKDNKGRAIGGFAVIEVQDEWVEGTVPVPRCHPKPDGTPYMEKVRSGRRHFHVATYATRDGHQFGAIPRGTFVSTLEAAKELAEKKVVEAARRFAKAVSKGEGRQFKRPG